jgi:hypothetical protein
MSSFPGSPRILKGGIVPLDPSDVGGADATYDRAAGL